MELINYFKIDGIINNVLSPFTSGVLGLPVSVGIVLLFGILRKELALVLFTSALAVNSTSQILQVIAPYQVFIFVIFVTFYMPCVATIAALIREFNFKKAMYSLATNFDSC